MISAERPKRNRPGAFELSFPGEVEDPATTSDASSRKRDHRDGDVESDRGAKRRNLYTVHPPARKYERQSYEAKERDDLILFGEEQDQPDDRKKRTRRLTRFTFFDAGHEDVMVSLDILDDDAKSDKHRVLAAGFAFVVYDVDEDEGQEEDMEDHGEVQYIRTTRVLRYFTNYRESDSPFFIETAHAIYEIDAEYAAKRYKKQFRPFWRLQKILKFVISSAAEYPERQFSSFIRRYNEVRVFDVPLTDRELWDAVPTLSTTLEKVPNADPLRETPVIHFLLNHMRPVISKPLPRVRPSATNEPRAPIKYTGNLDLAVHRESNQTHVTPRIGELAMGLFRERIRIVGPRSRPAPEVPKDDLALRLRGFLERTTTRRHIRFRLPDQRIGRTYWLKYAMIDDMKYEVGDTVLFYPTVGLPPKPEDLHPNDNLGNHFWFANIMGINEEHETVHVQWFEHSSKTLLQELGDSQELFLTHLCDTQALRHIIGKVTTHYIKPGDSLANVKPHDFYYRYMWESGDGTFTDVDVTAMEACARELPPKNCPACDDTNKFEDAMEFQRVHLGIRWHAIEYHYDDCILFKADEGTCHIGHITDFDFENEELVVRLFGRTDKVGCRPETMLKDERHLFYTNDEMVVSFRDLIGVCCVMVKESRPELEEWLAISPRHFYVKYHFPSINVTSWRDKRRMDWDDLPICPMCVKADFKKFRGMKEFLGVNEPLRTLDPFAGTGSFSLAMEETGCFKLTHAIEISPSAAQTIKNNASPDVKVYNQCTNLVLNHAILTHENKYPEPLKSIEGHVLPPPPQPGDIDCIIAGFPCQSHSTLNMFRKANDSKSNLILTALSMVDFMKPKYCIFENVRGFLQFNLLASQKNKFSVRGGIPMGGLKFVAAALLDMGYQLRCALLQAGHYGTPQQRTRFFLIGAKHGLELPAFPQPTHDFPGPDSLDIKISDDLILQPITTLPGVALHRSVSVFDAIGDLPKFDWKHPKKHLTRRQMEEGPIKECHENKPWCGFDGPDVPYEHEPRTRFQKECRSRPIRDIQQYTRTFDPKKVERIVEIPLEPDADWRSLRRDLWEWGLANPASATARSGFRGTFYGRVQLEQWFQTTVTHVDPTGKQGRVLHPYSKRIITVRELARSQGFPDYFVFHAHENRVMTMHRQIGNAVPWQVSKALAREFRETLYKAWEKDNPVAEESEVEFSSESELEDNDERSG